MPKENFSIGSPGGGPKNDYDQGSNWPKPDDGTTRPPAAKIVGGGGTDPTDKYGKPSMSSFRS